MPSNIKDIKRYLERIKFAKKLKVSKLKSGERNNNFLIETEKGKFVLRKARNDVPIIQYRLNKERIMLKFLEKKKINFVPQSIYYDKREKIHIISFLPGKIYSLKDLNQKQIKQLVKHLIKLNTIKFVDFVAFCQKHNFPRPRLERNEYNVFLYNDLKRHCRDRNIIEWAEKRIKDHRRLIKQFKKRKWFIHRDPNNNLIINKGKAYLIDWEMARFMFSRMDGSEISYVLSIEDLNKKTIKTFVAEYTTQSPIPLKELKEKINNTFKIFLIGHALWMAQRYTTMKRKKMMDWQKYYLKTFDKINRCDKKYNFLDFFYKNDG